VAFLGTGRQGCQTRDQLTLRPLRIGSPHRSGETAMTMRPVRIISVHSAGCRTGRRMTAHCPTFRA